MPTSKVCSPNDQGQAPENTCEPPTVTAEGPSEGNGSKRTFTAPSGKHYVIAQECYPSAPIEERAAFAAADKSSQYIDEEEGPTDQAEASEGAAATAVSDRALPSSLRSEILTASEGDLIELLMLQDDWGYGRRFKAPSQQVQNVNTEGIFRLEWVRGVRLQWENGRRMPVEIDISDPSFGFKVPKADDLASKLRVKRYRKKMSDAAQVWMSLQPTKSSSPRKQKVSESRSEPDHIKTPKKKKRGSNKHQHDQDRETDNTNRCNTATDHITNTNTNTDMNNCSNKSNSNTNARCRSASNGSHSNNSNSNHEWASASSPASSPRLRSADGPETGGRWTPNSLQSSDCSYSPPPRRPQVRQRKRKPLSEQRWEAQWEQQAAYLEQVLSASSGVEDNCHEDLPDQTTSPDRAATKKVFARSLLQAKRSGTLQAIAEEWEKVHTEMASKADDMNALQAKVKQSLREAHDDQDLYRIAEEMAGEAERQAVEVKALKERVFRAMKELSRSRSPHQEPEEMSVAQRELEAEAQQLKKKLMQKAWQGMLESRQTAELERTAQRMAEQLQAQADALKFKLQSGLLQAHRTGELRELRDELAVLAQNASQLDETAAAVARGDARISRSHPEPDDEAARASRTK